jgi:pilus assembly protein CpaF
MIPAIAFQGALDGLLSPIAPLLADEAVTEILVNGPTEIFVERKGKLSRSEHQFGSSERLLSGLRLIAQFVGRSFDADHPILEARLPDGSRVEALLPPIAPDGPSLAIRRFSKERLTLEKLLSFGALTPQAATFLAQVVECKQNVVVAGGTGSGKTSLLNALSALIPEDERVIVIEDSRELQLQRDHVVQFETRPADAKGRGAVSIRDLFKASLRMRPDRIVLGEIRAGEALDLVQAMTSGHGGCLTTVHATYPTDTLNRLETMALMSGVELPLSALRKQLGSAVDLIVQTSRFRDGSRGVTHITEVQGTNEAGHVLVDIFRREGGQLVSTGAMPACAELLRTHGHDVASLLTKTNDKETEQ